MNGKQSIFVVLLVLFVVPRAHAQATDPEQAYNSCVYSLNFKVKSCVVDAWKASLKSLADEKDEKLKAALKTLGDQKDATCEVKVKEAKTAATAECLANDASIVDQQQQASEAACSAQVQSAKLTEQQTWANSMNATALAADKSCKAAIDRAKTTPNTNVAHRGARATAMSELVARIKDATGITFTFWDADAGVVLFARAGFMVTLFLWDATSVSITPLDGTLSRVTLNCSPNTACAISTNASGAAYNAFIDVPAEKATALDSALRSALREYSRE